jgi:polysaccharide export outer membrane protein
MHHKIITIIALTVTLVLTGCTKVSNDIGCFTKPDIVDVIAENYILQPPDEIEVHSFNIPELHLQVQKIRPDGKVSFEALGEINAAGKTPKELALLMSERAMMLYSLTGEHPIDVRVSNFASSVYYVIGQVYLPGPKITTGRDTVLTALSAAQPTILAWKDYVKVIRPSIDENVPAKIFEINYNDMVSKGDLSRNVLLEEGDIIYVQPTVLAAIGMVIEEAMRPIGRAFSTVNIVQGAGPAN